MDAQRSGAAETTHTGSPDLPSQLESLLHVVWECERGWTVEDHVDRLARWSMLPTASRTR